MVYKQVGSLSRGLKIARLYKRNVSGKVTLLPGTELRPVSFNKRQQLKARKHFSRNIHGAPIFPQYFPVSHTGNIVSSVSFCFQNANYAFATRQGILTKNPACVHLQKFCEQEQASTHLIFASNSSKGQILRALSNWLGPFDTLINESFYNMRCIVMIITAVCLLFLLKSVEMTSSRQTYLKTRVKKPYLVEDYGRNQYTITDQND